MASFQTKTSWESPRKSENKMIWTSPTIVMKPDNNDGLEPQDRVDKICWTLTRHLTRWKPRLR